MRIVIIGAGPAGLYLSLLLKRSGLSVEVTVVEQNAPDSTFGFGVVFGENALEFLKEDDPEIFGAITPELEIWNDIAVVHRGVRVPIDGIGFSAIGRLHLLQLLQQQARAEGITIHFNRQVSDLSEFADADLIVGADGVSSLVRRSDETAFGTKLSYLTNRFAWFGTTKVFDVLTQTFIETPSGAITAHHYRYSPTMSTFLVECNEKTFFDSGFDRMSEDETRKTLQQHFAETLDGHPLISNRSIWRQFPVIRNEHWSSGNKVILGDALHTAHFSIGSGTRLAIEDAIALARAIRAHPRDVREALAAYEAQRKPILAKLVTAANNSAAWYENFSNHMALAPYDFAMSYLSRTGRMDIERIRKVASKFVAEYERQTKGAA
ncbi:FAD-dependent monooxygenase [Pseudorhodoplanes sinuspersici]|uniref:Monooxygenase n=1 Tax=Pseudorhodoplanes sinuspersici TaxID=1235591 RepID=A0A1W6ZS56_9HYPH|nr:FAD-dependent monooxygenase [Pseudorhodoplanes sinuspersici]ARQ00227.1 monooxygenase [Pseudorhodoplanes sinuspersici]RKE67627.1 2-polyprenyl-6-methoxyphenol hydroxylase-like FAD-dependent oxidoreductase [Pseudorhodoplanes sinuspersici]